MIQIMNYIKNDHSMDILGGEELNSSEKLILAGLACHENLIRYDDITRLQFETKLRSYIIESAIALNYSGVTYAIFEKSYCNPRFWALQADGGFKIRNNVTPASAIQDIYSNGSQYAFECATAMVIVYYKAVLAAINENHFNRLFQDILLWDWHYDKDLGISSGETNEFVPGDVLYFKNPDVNPSTPEWQGENVVFLERNTYYGHGIGIKNSQQMIDALNAHRRPGSSESAYLLQQATRPDFHYLSQFTDHPSDQTGHRNILDHMASFLIARIGSNTHIQG